MHVCCGYEYLIRLLIQLSVLRRVIMNFLFGKHSSSSLYISGHGLSLKKSSSCTSSCKRGVSSMARMSAGVVSCRIKAWIKKERHLSKRDFVRGLNRRLTGHYNYFGIIGNGHSINRFYLWAMECTFKWLNRRGGKRMSFTRETFWRAVDRGLFRKPRIMVGSSRRVFA